MGHLDGRVVIVTGGGRGLGRAYCLELAAEGASIIVNDAGRAPDGESDGATPATQVVQEIIEAGGRASASTSDITHWDEARELIESAVLTFGDLHAVVNNAGFLRDRTVVNMSEDEWDDVMNVHLKGAFLTTRFAAAYWRDLTKAGHDVKASIVHTTSTSGLDGNPGQSNYGAAKAGVASFSRITSMELARYGVSVNSIAPAARTRLTEAAPGLGPMVAAPDEPDQFDAWDPANVAPLVTYLVSADCNVTGRTFYMHGGMIQAYDPWRRTATLEQPGRWKFEELARSLPTLES